MEWNHQLVKLKLQMSSHFTSKSLRVIHTRTSSWFQRFFSVGRNHLWTQYMSISPEHMDEQRLIELAMLQLQCLDHEYNIAYWTTDEGDWFLSHKIESIPVFSMTFNGDSWFHFQSHGPSSPVWGFSGWKCPKPSPVSDLDMCHFQRKCPPMNER